MARQRTSRFFFISQESCFKKDCEVIRRSCQLLSVYNLSTFLEALSKRSAATGQDRTAIIPAST